MNSQIPLCLLPGWTRVLWRKGPLVFTQSGYSVVNLTGPGCVRGFGVAVNNPDLKLRVMEDGALLLEVSWSDLNGLGVDNFSSVWPFLDRFDVVNNIYSMEFSPELPFEFKKSFALEIQAPAGTASWTLIDSTMQAILYSPEPFLRGLKEASEGRVPRENL